MFSLERLMMVESLKIEVVEVLLEEVKLVSSSRYWLIEMWKKLGDLSLKAMEDEEVALVDGVFEGAFGALGDESWCFDDGVLVSS
nr:hypothetical protein [Tanacetum cinerariifolium]